MNRVTPALATALGALVLTAPPAHASDSATRLAHRESYGTKAMYEPERSARTYQKAPAGFTPVFTENVSRHGSRSATDSEDGDLILALWDKVEAAGQLTGKGDDLFRRVEAKKSGTSTLGAELRFTHAEEIIPLAALMGLPGSTKPVTEKRPYTYRSDPWRGADVAPLASTIQWDVYEKNGRYLVRMLYNEKETAFKASREPIVKGGALYDLNELERRFGRA